LLGRVSVTQLPRQTDSQRSGVAGIQTHELLGP